MQSRKVFAFFGSDLKGRNPDFLKRTHRDGYALLPLDSAGVTLAARAGLPYTLMEDWLDYSGILSALDAAQYCQENWFRAAREEFTAHGICWSELMQQVCWDHWIPKFWREVMLAEAFAKAFMAQGVEELRFFKNEPGAAFASPVASAAATVPLYWEKALPGLAVPLRRQALSVDRFRHTLLFRGLRKMVHTFRALRRSLPFRITPQAQGNEPSVELMEGGILFMMSRYEWFRFRPIVDALANCSPGRVVVLLREQDPEVAREFMVQAAVPVLVWPDVAPEPFLAQRFLSGLAKVLGASDGHPWQKALKFFESDFHFYCKDSLPRLASGFEYWLRQFVRYRPQMLVATAWQLPEALALIGAANRVGLTSFTVPHAGVCIPGKIHPSLATSYKLYSNGIQKNLYQRFGLADRQLLGCRGPLSEEEYTFRPVEAFPTKDAWKLLVLTECTDGESTSDKSITIRKQLEALRALAHPPPDLADRLLVRFKVHPTQFDLEMLKVTVEGFSEKLLAPDSDLLGALQETDLVVCVNYVGSGLIHVLRAGCPVISFLTQHESLVEHLTPTFACFISGATLARTPEELWSLVREFFTNPDSAAKMRQKARDFAQENLRDDHFPGICEIVSPYAQGPDFSRRGTKWT